MYKCLLSPFQDRIFLNEFFSSKIYVFRHFYQLLFWYNTYSIFVINCVYLPSWILLAWPKLLYVAISSKVHRECFFTLLYIQPYHPSIAYVGFVTRFVAHNLDMAIARFISCICNLRCAFKANVSANPIISRITICLLVIFPMIF